MYIIFNSKLCHISKLSRLICFDRFISIERNYWQKQKCDSRITWRELEQSPVAIRVIIEQLGICIARGSSIECIARTTCFAGISDAPIRRTDVQYRFAHYEQVPAYYRKWKSFYSIFVEYLYYWLFYAFRFEAKRDKI